MKLGRDFHAGLLIAAFFALVLFVLIPNHVKVPSFIPGFVPPPDMWPRAIAIVGLAMGLLALVFAVSRTRLGAAEKPVGMDDNPRADRVYILRFVQMATGFGVFVWLMPEIGFLAASIVLLAFLFAMTGRFDQRIWMLGLSVVFPIVLYVIFTEVAHIPFPPGKIFSLVTPPLSIRAGTTHVE